MVSTFTPNIQLEEPARGDDVGTWDTPVNNNMTLVDLVAGNITTIGLNNSNVVLASAQFQSKAITFNSTLTGSVSITFPTSFKKSYEIFNTCTGSSAFVITLATTAAGGQFVCCPPGEIIDVVNDGVNIRFKNLARIGAYWDYAGSSVPAWVSGSNPVPYLNCDGTTFSAATFPILALVLGSTTLPNSKGKARFVLDQGAGLISSAVGGFTSPNVSATGGAQTITLGTSNLPPYTPSGTVTGTTPVKEGSFVVSGGSGTLLYAPTGGSGTDAIPLQSGTLNGAAQGGVSQVMTNLPPAYIGGLTLIRAG
jgi:microcystin-dependent protein